MFHVTARGVAGNALFNDDVDRRDFILQLTRTTGGFLWTCHAYCLMTTHYHLLLETSREVLSQGMHRLNFLYAQRFNGRHGRRGHVFEGRFQAYLVESEEHFLAALHYIRENPVKAGLCELPEEWPWSGGVAHLDAVLSRAVQAGVKRNEGLTLVRAWPS